LSGKPSMMTDRSYLRDDQYRDATNLNARIHLHERFSTNLGRWHHWVFDQIKPHENGRLLELGCGPGSLWLENSGRIPGAWTITLSDFSFGMAEEARSALAKTRPRVQLEVSDAQAIPFPDKSFDTVIANHMLYHVTDRDRAFAEIRRVLEPGGHLYAATNGMDHFRELDELLTGFGIDTSFRFGKLFGLENGLNQLTPWFSNIAVRRYEDALEITESGPLMDYVLSGFLNSRLTDTALIQLRYTIDEEIARRGAFHITKDSGLLVAEKSR
jgi:SAM-dependent methyltransferase